MRHSRGWAVFLFLLTVLAVKSPVVRAQESSAQGTGPVERTYFMQYECIGANGQNCGDEFAIMTVQRDNTRTLRAYLRSAPALTSQGDDAYSQNNTVLRVDPQFRPLESYTSLYTGNNYWGSNLFAVDGSTFSITVDTPQKQDTVQTSVPDRFGLVLFVNSGYGWLFGDYDHDVGGAQSKKVCLLVPDDRATGCILLDQSIELIGTETITVPAGTFETEHYKLGEANTWVMGPDMVVVQHMHPARDGRAQLIDYEIQP